MPGPTSFAEHREIVVRARCAVHAEKEAAQSDMSIDGNVKSLENSVFANHRLSEEVEPQDRFELSGITSGHTVYRERHTLGNPAGLFVTKVCRFRLVKRPFGRC